MTRPELKVADRGYGGGSGEGKGLLYPNSRKRREHKPAGVVGGMGTLVLLASGGGESCVRDARLG